MTAPTAPLLTTPDKVALYGKPDPLSVYALPSPTGVAATDTQAINAGIASGARKLTFADGTYLHNGGLAIPSNQHWDGAGVGVTTLKLANGANRDSIVNADAVNGNPRVSITNMTVDGNKAGQSGTNSHFGIHLVRCANHTLDHLEVMNVDGHGVVVDGQGTVTRGGQLSNIVAHDNSQIGVWGTFASRNIEYTNVYAYNNGLDGVQFDHSEAKVSNIDAQGNGRRGIFIRNVFGCVYNNLSATLNGQDGIYVQGMTNSLGSDWFAANNSTSSTGTYHDINFSGDNTLSYGITTSSVVIGVQANPNGNFGTTTEGYALFVGDPTSGSFGDLKIIGLFGAGVTGQFRTPASAGGLVIMDFPGGTANLRWWLGTGLATPNGFQLGTSAAHKLGFYGAAAIVQQARAGQLTDSSGGTASGTIAAGITDTVAKNAVASLAARLNAVEAIIHNLGLSA